MAKKNKEPAVPAQTAPAKDYQQEEDSEVKRKKIRNTIIAIILFIIIVFVALFLFTKVLPNRERYYDPDGVAQEAFAQADENNEDFKVEDSLLDLSGQTVDVTVPVEYYQGSAPSGLTNSEKKLGYISVKNDGRNVVYTLKTSQYRAIVNELFNRYDASFNDKYEKKDRIELVSMNRKAQVFTITIEKLAFNPNNYKNMFEDLYYHAAIYQCFYGFIPSDGAQTADDKKDDTIKVTFQIKYHQAQRPFLYYHYPDLLGKENLGETVQFDEKNFAPLVTKRYTKKDQ